MTAGITSEDVGDEPGRRLLARVETAQRAAREAIGALEKAVQALELSREDLLSGATAVVAVEWMIARGGTAARLRASHALTEYSASGLGVRAEVVRVMVDDAGMSISDAGRKLGVSRQLAARLYRVALDRGRG